MSETRMKRGGRSAAIGTIVSMPKLDTVHIVRAITCGPQFARTQSSAPANVIGVARIHLQLSIASAVELRGGMMPQTLRSSGIPFLDDVPWGSHLCVFYETDDDLIEAAARFFEQGLENNELCVWALPAALGGDAAGRLNEQLADLDAHLAGGRMRFVTQADWYPHAAAAGLAET